MYLNSHSFFSLRFGTFSIEDLTSTALEIGVRKLALTDINSTSGVFEFVQQCNAKDLLPVVGNEVRNGNTLLFISLTRNENGFNEINLFLTQFLLSKRSFPVRAPAF